MKVEMKFSTPKLEKLFRGDSLDLVEKNLNGAKAELIEMMINDTDKYVPYDTGHLAESATALSGNAGVEYAAEYAGYVSSMPPSYDFSHKVHPLATPNWVEVSLSENVGRWIKAFTQSLLGGRK